MFHYFENLYCKLVNILNPNFQKLGVGYNYNDEDKANLRYYWTQLFADSLNTAETVSTAELLTAIPEVNTVTNLVTLSEDADTYSNNDYGATIAALGGDDKITNTGLIVSISGGAGNDTINNIGSDTSIFGGGGTDSIYNEGANVTIDGGGDNDAVVCDPGWGGGGCSRFHRLIGA